MYNQFKWDPYSDQPCLVEDRKFKRKMRLITFADQLRMLLSIILFFPIILVFYFITPLKKCPIKKNKYFGLCVNINREPDLVYELVKDLNVNQLLIRVPLADIDNIQKYLSFAKQFSEQEILINILQDRPNIDNPELCKKNIQLVFKTFLPITNSFQIGNAINRFKWGFFSIDEYLKFYQIAYQIQQEKYPDIILTGSSVIDFEVNSLIRSLYHLYKIRYHQVASLLYVDRRGAPENTQSSFNLPRKIRLIYQAIRLSPKADSKLIITETNWPLLNTEPYAPAAPDVAVDLETAANYLVRYYLLALCTGLVETVYWHQLIAPGYGLIDNRLDKITKYPAYFAFKTINYLLQGKQVIDYQFEKEGLHQVTLTDDKVRVEVYWSLKPVEMDLSASIKALSCTGEVIVDKKVMIHESPVYSINHLFE